jgi:hypothetical protein
MPLGLQTALHEVRNRRLVLDNQNSHSDIVGPRGGPRSAAA